METQKRLLLALAGGAIVLMSLMACDNNPSRIATGEEVEAAVRNAEAQMVEARAKRIWRPCQGAQTARADTF
jgi:hypothetical protein